jgi:hypothetical protein
VASADAGSGRARSHCDAPALSAALHSCRPELGPRSALEPALAGTNGDAESTLEPVYDLTIAEVPEFFANGILVHNCTWDPLNPSAKSPNRIDALVHGLTDLMLGGGVPTFSFAPGGLSMHRDREED